PDDSPLNCADIGTQDQMIALIDKAKEDGDTLGGIFEVVARGVVTGVGSHTSWKEKLDGRIAQAFMSIHAVKAVEIGTGVSNAAKPGSEVHDEIFYQAAQDGVSSPTVREGSIEPNGALTDARATDTTPHFTRHTNRAGGLEGGITNGEELRIRGYLKPISTLRRPLASVDVVTKQESAAAFERSDIVAVPAAGVIGEGMVAIVLAGAAGEKFGGDSIDETRRNYQGYLNQIQQY